MSETIESQENQNEEAAVPAMTTVERAEMLLQQDAAISAESEPMPPADGAELEQWFGGQDGVASILNSLKMFEQD